MSTRVAIITAALLAFGCAADRRANPGFGCEIDSDCARGLSCDRGFCVGSEMDAGVACGPEIACNGIDEDCDGTVDEFSDSACETNAPGVCGEGMWICSGGAPVCSRTVVPEPETCNGRDDDCDVSVDELEPIECFPEASRGCSDTDGDGVLECLGTCNVGTSACVGGAQDACRGFVAAAPGESCGDAIGVDEDCDGLIDEGCGCSSDRVCYGGPARTLGVGACRAGVQSCVDGAIDPTCTDQVVPTPETCANPGTDDDCDGVVDDVPRVGEPCIAAAALGDCRLGRLACREGAPAPSCEPGAPRTEVCNGNDDDCDGSVDEAFDLSADPANCGACGTVCGSDEACCAGACVDARSDSANCGACASAGGALCASSEVCCGGVCAHAASCESCTEDCGATGRTCCTGACVDTTGDESNCGGCGVACAAGRICCGGACVASDDTHCGQSCARCASGAELCCAGACVTIGVDHCNACGVSCSVGTCCATGCVDTGADAMNCGRCGNACPVGQACSRGSCCPVGQTWCAESGCRNLANDGAHCGACGRACGVGSVCCGGSCRPLALGCGG